MLRLPPLGRSSYQRRPVDDPAVTLWFTTSAVWSPMLRWGSGYISRSARESSLCVVPDCGMQVPPAQASAYDATPRLIGPLNVELDGVVQSTWYFQVARLDVVPSATT